MLVKFNGDRTKAAESIGVTTRQLSNRIDCFANLRVKWSPRVQEVMKAIVGTESPLAVIEQMLAQAHVALDDHRLKIVEDIKRVRDRLEKGKFNLTVKGEPAEETMLWGTLTNLYELLMKHTATFERGVATKVKLHVLLQKSNAEAGGDMMKRAKPGFRPKGMMSTRTIQLLASPAEEPEIPKEPKPLTENQEWERTKAEIKGTA